MTAHHLRPPGITRTPTSQGTPRFRYAGPGGEAIADDATLARIAALALPPAWTEVWIDAGPAAKVQAVGVDAAGRTQYRYSPAWTTLRSREKFAHIEDFAGALPGLRAHVAAALRPRTARLDRDRVLSAAVRLLVHTATRIDATAKQFRTWAGTVLAAAALGGARYDGTGRSPVLAAVRAASRLLGNTPAVARSSYIHPGVLTAYEAGRTAEQAVRAAAARTGDDRLATLWRDPEVQAATVELLRA